MNRNETVEKHYREYATKLVSLMARRVGPVDAEDIIQEAYFRAIRSWESYTPALNFGTWFSGVMESARKDGAFKSIASTFDGDDNLAFSFPPAGEAAYELSQIREMIEEEPVQNRIALLMVLVLGYTSEEAGASVDLTPGNVRLLVHRFRERLK